MDADRPYPREVVFKRGQNMSVFSGDILKDKVAIVTGGATGIGLAVARALARHGAKVALAARHVERLEEAARELGGIAVPTDIAEPEQVRALISRVELELGPIDILVNNAAANFVRPSEALTPVRWRKIVDIVLNGTFFCALEAGRRMLARRSGKIVNLVAAYAWTGGPGFAPSASAKAGVVALTRTLGVEWAGRGVRVNAVCPGIVDTPQSRERLWPEEWMRRDLLSRVPAGRFGKEEEIADSVLYLVSPAGDYIAGEVLVVDGGESLGKGALSFMKKEMEVA